MGTTNESIRGGERTRKRLRDDEPPYARYAFWNPYNVSLFLGGVVVGVATGHERLSVLTCAAEVLWMIFAPDSRLLRGLWFDRAFEAAKKADDAERRQERSGLLSPGDSQRLGYRAGRSRSSSGSRRRIRRSPSTSSTASSRSSTSCSTTSSS